MKIGIVGLGLIGGSLAIDLRRLGHWVVGVSRRPETCQRAIALGIVDDAGSALSSMAAAEVVFLCTPLGVMEATVQALVPHLSPHTILTDVGSVKQPIVDMLTCYWTPVVGGHPMAGTADSGLEAAQADLFAQRPYVLTPTPATPADAVETVADLARSLQSQVVCCSPQEHDQAVAWISHLPVMVSACLIQSCMAEPHAAILRLAQQLASSGFRDTSRVGGGNPELGIMMARYNQSALLEALTHYRASLDQLIQQVNQSDWGAIATLLEQTQGDRPSFL
ncbi:MAG: prephenate/arogenate dehydrogenase [Kaiparowitsia implicata GSE-PSE-MK54-09C]|jgi:arogenate dehydrogenase (NADP+)|nr:prephenate/arogenate dehydrogenase [Kaiparowitsia implicata GSE-PSE-MK54-09C]